MFVQQMIARSRGAARRVVDATRRADDSSDRAPVTSSQQADPPAKILAVRRCSTPPGTPRPPVPSWPGELADARALGLDAEHKQARPACGSRCARRWSSSPTAWAT